VTSKTIEVKQKLIWLNRLSRSEELWHNTKRKDIEFYF
jgi:hypothetical protein